NYKIPVEVVLYSKERELDATIRIEHSLTRFSELDRRQYDQAQTVIENMRSAQIYQESNWDALEGLYNSKVTSVTGVLLNGEPCTEKNMPSWLDRIRFCRKIEVVNAAIREIDAKNAL